MLTKPISNEKKPTFKGNDSTPALTRLLRLREIIGDPNAVPPIQPIVPVSRSTWWAGIKAGRFPAPVKLGPRISAWRETEIRTIVRSGAE